MSQTYLPPRFNAIVEEFIKIQKSLLKGEMCETDLNNWFFDFCDRIGCGVDVTHCSQTKQTEKVVSKSEPRSAVGVVFNCTKDGEFSVGALTFVKQTPLDLIVHKLKEPFALYESKEGWYTISDDSGINKYLNRINTEN
jgi:hypothetical protein